ncbi:hypothetical protein ACQBAR_06205 [Propionibacteriaceae bacterium Y1685]|uniref:hypothetical protein n=1 Tax=Microlunatus sp. Y1700 TaxID=3418487 RepID=UPI003B80D164
MAWKDWDLTNKVVVSACALVVMAVLVTFAVIALRPETKPPEVPPSTAQPSDSASPSPTYQCTTAEGSECTKELAEKEADRDRTYADSKKALDIYYAELTKARKAGGAEGKLPAALDAVVADEIKKETLEGLEAIKLQDLYYSGETKLTRLRIDPRTPEWPREAVHYRLCVDSRNLNGLKRGSDEYVRSGILADTVVSVSKRPDSWQVSAVDTTEVDEC